MFHQTFLFLGQLWQLFEVSQILEFLRYYTLSPEYAALEVSKQSLIRGDNLVISFPLDLHFTKLTVSFGTDFVILSVLGAHVSVILIQ